MKHVNLSNISKAYTERDHERYIAADNGACVEIISVVDDDGDFKLDHGYYPGVNTDRVLLPVQGRYHEMIEWIASVAKEGEL